MNKEYEDIIERVMGEPGDVAHLTDAEVRTLVFEHNRTAFNNNVINYPLEEGKIHTVCGKRIEVYKNGGIITDGKTIVINGQGNCMLLDTL